MSPGEDRAMAMSVHELAQLGGYLATPETRRQLLRALLGVASHLCEEGGVEKAAFVRTLQNAACAYRCPCPACKARAATAAEAPAGNGDRAALLASIGMHGPAGAYIFAGREDHVRELQAMAAEGLISLTHKGGTRYHAALIAAPATEGGAP